MNIHNDNANSIGLTPVDFKSLIEIVDPTKNNVRIKRRLEITTIPPVIGSGRIWKLLINMATINSTIK